MNTNRFETFYDAVLAIVVTILVLKIPQPLGPGWGAFFSNNINIITYLIVFLAIINIWYSNQRLFQHIESINNKSIIAYGFSIFLFSLFPYFASWLSFNLYSLTAEVIFGLLMIFSNISHIIAVVVVFGTNHSSDKLEELNIKKSYFLTPILIIAIGFVISFTVFTPGIYVASLFSILLSILFHRKEGAELEETERFEALIDAIIAIIITVIVLEIPTAANGSLPALLELRIEFIAYAVSFIVCFHVWNFTYNLFNFFNKINHRAIWSIATGLFFLSLIPYLTTYVAMNFHDFVPQFLYGLDFVIVNLCSFLATYEMKKIDESNELLEGSFRNYDRFVLNIIITFVFMAIGYIFYPPLVIVSCLLSIVMTWIFRVKHIDLLDIT